MGPERSRRQRGFTLLEVLIGLSIAGLALMALFDGAALGLRSVERAGRTAEALSHARSHLAALGQSGPLLPGETTGDDGGGFRWRRRIALLGVLPALQGGATALYDVRVTIGWDEAGKDRGIELAGRLLGRLP
jgi:prepilin-type N-terminal cleavage/methylation domain-containing protein